MSRPERRHAVGAEVVGGRRARNGAAMYFHTFFHQRTGPRSAQPRRRSPGIAVEPDVHVIVVRLRVGRLVEDVRRARQQRRIVAGGGGLAQERSAPGSRCMKIHCTSASAIAEQRAHERPVSGARRSGTRARAGRRARPLRRRPANRAPVRRRSGAWRRSGAPGAPPRRWRNRRRRRRARSGATGARPRRRPPDATDRRWPPSRPAARDRRRGPRARRADQLVGAVVAVPGPPAAPGPCSRHRRTAARPGGEASRRPSSPIEALETFMRQRTRAPPPPPPAERPEATRGPPSAAGEDGSAAEPIAGGTEPSQGSA